MVRGARRGQRDTGKAIVDAAVGLFYRHGYQATTLRQIADEVGVQVGSLYNYISSKEQLLFDIMSHIMVDLVQGVRAELDGVDDPLERIERFMRYSIRFHAERQEETFIGNTELRSLSPDLLHSIVRLRDEYETLLRSALQDAAHGGQIVLHDPQLATFAGLAVCSHVATWYQPGGRRSLDEIAEELCAAYAPLQPRRLAEPVR